jgi:uncharacterized spore protein YtfJ
MTTEIPVGPTTEPPRRRSDEILAMLADRVGGRLTVSTVFGSPVEREGVTVIPVSTVRFGFGGGGGTDPSSEQSGEGGGGAGSAAPAGYIEIKDGRSRFVPVVHPARMAALCCATAIAMALILRPGHARPTEARRRRPASRSQAVWPRGLARTSSKLQSPSIVDPSRRNRRLGR